VRVVTTILQGSVTVSTTGCAQKQHGPHVIAGSSLVISPSLSLKITVSQFDSASGHQLELLTTTKWLIDLNRA